MAANAGSALEAELTELRRWKYAADFINYVLGFGAIGLGAALAIVPRSHVSGPSYYWLREELAMGAPVVWGYLWIIIGALTIISRAFNKNKFIAALFHGVAATGFMLFAVCFALSGLLNPNASVTQVPAYGIIIAGVHIAYGHTELSAWLASRRALVKGS